MPLSRAESFILSWNRYKILLQGQPAAGGSVEATRRGSMAVADQANACVSTSTTPLDPHERLRPAGATLGVGNLLKDVRVRLSA